MRGLKAVYPGPQLVCATNDRLMAFSRQPTYLHSEILGCKQVWYCAGSMSSKPLCTTLGGSVGLVAPQTS